MAPGETPPLLEFAEVMRHLRAECSWKQAQTHRSLARHLLEETHETLEAIDVGDATGDWAHLREELGDLLLQVYFHAVIAEEQGEFTLDDVATDVTAKMMRRNPHVYGTAEQRATIELDPASVTEAWETAKAAEKQRESPLEGLPPGLPALLMADKVIDRMERAGQPLDPQVGDAGEGNDQGADVGTGIGDRLLALVAESRDLGVDPEQALRDAVRRRL
ncbi:MazG family protein [Nocardioides gilvus]|uniref:MazG family protein n=1 Tax=Nocardioides gilvus TaxID=1735589 RepID=UPI000D747761|nr:MazG family protein [Nocardioides gilvus]